MSIENRMPGEGEMQDEEPMVPENNSLDSMEGLPEVKKEEEFDYSKELSKLREIKEKRLQKFNELQEEVAKAYGMDTTKLMSEGYDLEEKIVKPAREDAERRSGSFSVQKFFSDRGSSEKTFQIWELYSKMHNKNAEILQDFNKGVDALEAKKEKKQMDDARSQLDKLEEI